jgi:hypothetical protein
MGELREVSEREIELIPWRRESSNVSRAYYHEK